MMSRYRYSDEEKKRNTVLMHQFSELQSIKNTNKEVKDSVEKIIGESESLLNELGIPLNQVSSIEWNPPTGEIVIPSWSELCRNAEENVGAEVNLENLFSKDEIFDNERVIQSLNEDYKAIHKLDKDDIAISAMAGIIGALVDILMVGIPVKTSKGLEGKPLSTFVREWFEKVLPEEEMRKLANSKKSKVPYDAQDNRNTKIDVEGLSSYYHRVLSLGHDPLLGFLVGVFDIMTCRMTTIDKNGKFVSQVMENYIDRKETELFEAIAKQIRHLKSDVTTAMGLPAPLMGVFNLFQFGDIEGKTIAEIVQGMYFEGYDFVHFSSLSISAMVVEVIVRMGYALKRIRNGYSIRESIPISLNREQNPKLSTMLFISHSVASGINVGKIYFMKNPMAINYPQWLLFARYSYSQLKWALYDQAELGDAYVRGIISDDLVKAYKDIDEKFQQQSEEYAIVFQ